MATHSQSSDDVAYVGITTTIEGNQMTDTVFVEGIRAFKPHENAPDFVKASLVITPDLLSAWAGNNGQHMTDYNGHGQVRLQLKESREGKYYTSVDTYKPKQSTDPSEGVPF